MSYSMMPQTNYIMLSLVLLTSVSVATMMLTAAKNKREKAMQELDKIRCEQRSLKSKTHKLLEKVLPSTAIKNKTSSSGTTSAAKKSRKS